MSNPVKDRRDNVVMTNKDDVWKYRRVSWQNLRRGYPFIDENTGARISNDEMEAFFRAVLAAAPLWHRVIGFFYINFLRLRGHGLSPRYWFWVVTGQNKMPVQRTVRWWPWG